VYPIGATLMRVDEAAKQKNEDEKRKGGDAR
jgi:hypothetical protein